MKRRNPIPESQHPNPGWEWYQPTTISGLQRKLSLGNCEFSNFFFFFNLKKFVLPASLLQHFQHLRLKYRIHRFHTNSLTRKENPKHQQINQSINQSINPSVNRQLNQSIDQSSNHSNHDSDPRKTNQSTNQSSEHKSYRSRLRHGENINHAHGIIVHEFSQHQSHDFHGHSCTSVLQHLQDKQTKRIEKTFEKSQKLELVHQPSTARERICRPARRCPRWACLLAVLVAKNE